MQLCAKYGIVLDELEQQAVKLLHSKTGACVARHVYGVSDDIYEAIFWHTTGKADMTLLEKLLYIADYMEPTRDFPGVERLRALAYEDLDAAVLLGCEMSIQEMAERGLPVHPNTVKARDWLRSKTKGTADQMNPNRERTIKHAWYRSRRVPGGKKRPSGRKSPAGRAPKSRRFCWGCILP